MCGSQDSQYWGGLGETGTHRLVIACVFCSSSSGTSCWEIKVFEPISVLPLTPILKA